MTVGHETLLAHSWDWHFSREQKIPIYLIIILQEGTNIYFLTVKHIHPHQELTVWYCREFAERMRYPITGGEMVKELGTLKMKEEELEAQKQAAIEKVKELLNKQKQIAQMKTDLLQQGLTRNLIKTDLTFEDEFVAKNITDNPQNKATSPRYKHDWSPVRKFSAC